MKQENNSGCTIDSISLDDINGAVSDDKNYANTIVLQSSNELYDYHNRGLYNGVPVSTEARNLPIDTAELLQDALELKQRGHVILLNIKPGNDVDLEKYNDLLEKQAAGNIIITEENKQYDIELHSYIILIKYMEVCYSLHPRYIYLKEDKKD